MLRLAAMAAAALALFGGAAAAQTFDPKEGFNPPIGDEMVAGMSGLVLDNLQRFRCGDAACAAATAEEKAKGLIPAADAREVIRRGMLSQVGECAGLDWQKAGFEPMMRDWRHGRKASARQLAFVGGLHGLAMGVTLQSLGGSCPKR